MQNRYLAGSHLCCSHSSQITYKVAKLACTRCIEQKVLGMCSRQRMKYINIKQTFNCRSQIDPSTVNGWESLFKVTRHNWISHNKLQADIDLFISRYMSYLCCVSIHSMTHPLYAALLVCFTVLMVLTARKPIFELAYRPAQ